VGPPPGPDIPEAIARAIASVEAPDPAWADRAAGGTVVDHARLDVALGLGARAGVAVEAEHITRLDDCAVDLLGGPPPTLLAEDPATALLVAGQDPATVAAAQR